MQPYTNTILIVDDEPAGRATLEALLMNQGYNLIFAENGADALQKAADFAPDLILSDVMMPDMDGFEVCQRLRANPNLAEVPIIMVTALDDRDSRLQGIEAGADDFITKPFDRAELRTRVGTITRLNRFRRLLTERNKFDWVIDHAEEGYLIIKNGEIRYANQKARLFLSLPADSSQPINKSFQELVRENYRVEPQANWFKEVWPEPSDYLQSDPQYLVRPETPTSNAFWLQVNLLQINSTDNVSGEWIIHLRDVTQEMDMKRSRWQFQAMVSHKLRTPMISMLSGMELLAAHAEEFSIAEITQLAERAVRSTQRLRSEIDDILQHTRISVIPRPGLNEELALEQLQPLVVEICQDLKLDHVTFLMQQEMEGSNILTISQSAIKLILREILENAQKFHPTGTPCITIHASHSGDNQAVSIKVTDDGLTLSPEQLAQAWTPYYQGEKYFTGEVAGMGLGLSMVASIVWNLGGSCQMYNREPGPGVIVELVLPLEKPIEKSNHTMERLIDPHTKTSTQAQNPPPQVLIVDDEPSARATLEALLYPEGYSLAFAANGQAALSLVAELEPDVILLDVMMPDTDGFTICQHLKAEKRWRHIPVIIVTALDSKEDLVRGLEAGADEFLSKPVNGLELRARVRSMLRIKKQYDSLQATMRVREDLASMIAHDMRNLLSPILGFSQILAIMSDLTEAEIAEFAETIYTQAHRLSSFIDDMLLMAKTEQTRLILNYAPVDMNSLIGAVESTHRIVAQSKGINLAIDIPAETQITPIDKNLFQRLLDNLVANALKFSPTGGTVTLKLEYPSLLETAQTPKNAALIRVKVMDEGPGIAAENRERIFEKFETVAMKKSGVSQVGLGLAFCKMVTEAHGGHIFVQANQPIGSIFVVEI